MLSREHRSCKRAVLGTQSAASIIFARMEGQLITYGKQIPVRGLEQFPFHER
jgi:hypothetical protein